MTGWYDIEGVIWGFFWFGVWFTGRRDFLGFATKVHANIFLSFLSVK